MIMVEQKRLENSLKANEQVMFFPTKVLFSDKGLLERVSVLNIKHYMTVNKTFQNDICPVCGELVTSDLFVSDRKGQKMHLDCLKQNQ